MTIPSVKFGIWDVLFKVNQILLPLIFVWGVWVTSSLYKLQAFANEGARYTQDEAEKDLSNAILLMKEWVRTNYPPPKLEARIEDIEQQVKTNYTKLVQIETRLSQLHNGK